MTNPRDPGHSPQPPASGPPGGPYGPPPQPQQPGPVPGPRPPGPAYGPQDRQPGWSPPPREPAHKGVLGGLFDMNFDNMITARLVKIVYALSLIPITLGSLLVAAYGVAWIQQESGFGYLLLVASPFLWLFQMLATRMVLEFVINQFKISEYLKAIKDKD